MIPPTTFPFGETVVWRQRTTGPRNADGNDTFTWVDMPVPGCVFAPAGSAEVVQGRDTVTDTATEYMPASTAVAAVDRIVRGIDVYEVVGAPTRFASPFDGSPGVLVVRLGKVTG